MNTPSGPSTADPNSDPNETWLSSNHVQTIMLAALSVSGIYLCYQMAMPFLASLTWSVALAVLFTPLQGWLESRYKHPNTTTIIAIAIILVMVVTPIIMVAQQLIQEAAKGGQLLKAAMESGTWKQPLEPQARFAPLLTWLEQKLDLPTAARSVASGLTSLASLVLMGSCVQAGVFCLTFYLLFFLLRDRRLMRRGLIHFSPLSSKEMEQLFSRVSDTIYATVYGTLIVAMVQGTLGGLMFWWLGLPTPVIWGIVMALLAVVPMVGASIVWFPAAVFLCLQGHWGQSLILVLWGFLLVSTIDNILRPVLVGKRLKLHTVPAFMSVVGGLVVFGMAGIIIGPIVLTVTMEFIKIWRQRVWRGC